MDQAFFLKMFAALIAIVSPPANLPVFLSLTAGRTPAEQRSVAITAIAGLTIGAVVVSFTGEAILTLFGISLDAFRLAGGFLILLIAINLVSGEQSNVHHGTDEERRRQAFAGNPGIYPLAVPMLLGPGTITTLIIFRGEAVDRADDIAYAAALGLTIALMAGTLLAAPFLGRMMGETATSIMSRIMGMLLAAIAMEMMVASLKVLLPGLA
ncbi:MAG: MarC family protein [Pannonibacter sp.]